MALMAIRVRETGERFIQREDESPLGFVVRVWRTTDPESFEGWIVKRDGIEVPMPVRAELDALLGGSGPVAPNGRQSIYQLDRHIGNLARYVVKLQSEQQDAPSPARGKLIVKLSRKARRLTNQLSYRMAVDGWWDETEKVFHGSETQGRDVHDRDRDKAYWFEHLRTEDDSMILRRWGMPNDVTYDDDDWEAEMVSYRYSQLNEVLTRYFGTSRWEYKQIVTRWKKRRGRWVPAEKVYVKRWVEDQIALYGTLPGLSHCLGKVKQRLIRTGAGA
jgi:hypothetical protein